MSAGPHRLRPACIEGPEMTDQETYFRKMAGDTWANQSMAAIQEAIRWAWNEIQELRDQVRQSQLENENRQLREEVDRLRLRVKELEEAITTVVYDVAPPATISAIVGPPFPESFEGPK